MKDNLHKTIDNLEEQKEDRLRLFGKNAGLLDYVACWYKKASEFMLGTKIKAAFVSTNSICQGQQVAPLWKDLMEHGLKIFFAHRTFKWNSESQKTATVFVVIVGFSYDDVTPKFLYTLGTSKNVEHINAYLTEASDVFVMKSFLVLPEKSAKNPCGFQ